MTEIEQFIIDRVREIRRKHNTTQATLAECLGVSAGFIGDVESSRKSAKYNFNHLNAIADYFECPFADFFPEKAFPVKDKEKKTRKKRDNGTKGRQ